MLAGEAAGEELMAGVACNFVGFLQAERSHLHTTRRGETKEVDMRLPSKLQKGCFE